jgi:outer membrane protein assembly factor BamE (lipoprotein component of BamABCDE complex)
MRKITRGFLVGCGLMAAITLAGIVGFVAYLDDSMNGWPVSQKAAAQIKAGMSQEDVLKILGTSSSTSAYAEEPGSASWHYSKRHLWCTYNVTFQNHLVTDASLDN